MEQREKDIQRVCTRIVNSSITQTGDSGSGGMCPYCFEDCSWKDEIEDVKHEPDCIYFIAKDLMAGFNPTL